MHTDDSSTPFYKHTACQTPACVPTTNIHPVVQRQLSQNQSFADIQARSFEWALNRLSDPLVLTTHADLALKRSCHSKLKQCDLAECFLCILLHACWPQSLVLVAHKIHFCCPTEYLKKCLVCTKTICAEQSTYRFASELCRASLEQSVRCRNTSTLCPQQRYCSFLGVVWHLKIWSLE